MKGGGKPSHVAGEVGAVMGAAAAAQRRSGRQGRGRSFHGEICQLARHMALQLRQKLRGLTFTLRSVTMSART